MFAKLTLLLLLSASPGFQKVDQVDGVLIEARPVEGSKLVELRLTTTTTRTVKSLCDAAFGTGAFDPQEPDLKARTIVFEGEDQRVTYEQISPPLVANRDYAVRATRSRDADGTCRMSFAAANELAPKVPPGWVRIEKLKGVWVFEPAADHQTKVTYVIHTDPAGAIPAFLVEGSRRQVALRWVKMLIARAVDPG